MDIRQLATLYLKAIGRVAKVAAKAANKTEADAGLRDLETALQGVD